MHLLVEFGAVTVLAALALHQRFQLLFIGYLVRSALSRFSRGGQKWHCIRCYLQWACQPIMLIIHDRHDTGATLTKAKLLFRVEAG